MVLLTRTAVGIMKASVVARKQAAFTTRKKKRVVAAFIIIDYHTPVHSPLLALLSTPINNSQRKKKHMDETWHSRIR